jgi:tRNA threonylcarbamoyladenosine biosynthesis protein TsaB
MIVTIKTDNPVAEIGLYDQAGTQLSYFTWQADRQLAKDLLGTLRAELAKQKADWSDIKGVIVFEGPGSFTGLRIGATVANTLAYGQSVPIVGARYDDWIAAGLAKLQAGANDMQVLPHYGAEATITKPKK